MAILDVLGELTGFSTPKKAWSLKNDDTDEVIRGQYVPQNYTENIGSNIIDSITLNQQDPFPQWINGQAETITFTGRLFATNSSKNIKQDVDILKSANKKVESLKRPPIFTFTYGVEIAFKCFVITVGGIKYDEIRGDGTLRGVEFNISLRKIVPEDIQGQSAASNLAAKIKTAAGIVIGATAIASSLNLINIPGGSLHKKSRTIKVKRGDTFESIASLEYGNALVGDILRRIQPDKVILQTGDNVILVDEIEIFQINVTPQSVALKDTEEVKIIKELKFAARNRTSVNIFT